jgi:ectoine hydroxylase-related dioxygenase (phytanoyl-CoA dioxygenase family)
MDDAGSVERTVEAEYDPYADVPNKSWDPSADLDEIWRDIKACDLTENVAEYEAYGYTVVPPEKVAPPEFHAKVLEAVLGVHERRTGHKVDLNGNSGIDSPLTQTNDIMREDPIFEKLPLIPAVYAMARYACGRSVVLSEINCSVKNQDPRRTHSLHVDQIGTPPPNPPYAQMLNVTWTLTDYSKELGTTAMVPCSHRFGRMPLSYEADFLAENPAVRAVPVESKAGSLIIWHGALWHGAYPRSAPGVRVNTVLPFTRWYMRPQRDFRRECPPEVLARNPPEFAQLMGMDCIYPVDEQVLNRARADKSALMRSVNSGEGQWA